MCAIFFCAQIRNIRLSFCVLGTPSFTHRSNSSKDWNGLFLKASRLVFFVFDCLHILVQLVSSIMSWRHKLTHRRREKLARVNPNKFSASVSRLISENLINWSFPCKYYWLSTNHVFPDFLPKHFVALCNWTKSCSTPLVLKNVGEIGYSAARFKHVNTVFTTQCSHFVHRFLLGLCSCCSTTNNVRIFSHIPH